jgi:DNA-binding transcriptional ArsR family regulator
MDENRPSYYAIIPADVRYDDQIPANAKLLYGEISALIGKDGFCFASNQYFSEIYGFSDPTISRLIKKLEDAGYVKRVLEKDKSGQVVRRKIYLSVSVPEIHPPINFDTTSPQNCGEGGIKNDGDTNTSITDIKESKKRKTPKEAPEPMTDEQLRDAVVTAIKRIADPSWSKDTKNELFALAMTMYDPNRTVKKAHPVRSQGSVDAMFRKLVKYGGTNPDVMICMLCSAIEAGWQGVQPPNGNQVAAAHQQPSSQRRDEEWL